METIIAGMASYPARKDAMTKAINSILPQVDHLHVCLTGYKKEPFQSDRITWHFQNGELGDAGKFIAVDDVQGIFLSVDDDLIYPRDYTYGLTKYLKINRKAFVGAHGVRLKRPIRSYYASRIVYHCAGLVNTMQKVDILGTGVMAFDTRENPISVNDFKVKNMADIWAAVFAKANNSPMFVVPHSKGWIKHLDIDLNDTIYVKQRNCDHLQTAIVKQVFN